MRAPSATEAYDQLCSRWAGLMMRIDQRRPFQLTWSIENALSEYLREATTILGGSFAEVIEFLSEERDPLLAELVRALPRDDRDGALDRIIRKLHDWRNAE